MTSTREFARLHRASDRRSESSHQIVISFRTTYRNWSPVRSSPRGNASTMTGHRGRHDLRGAYTCKEAIEAEKEDAERRPHTFAQTNLSLSLFACDKAADHTFPQADFWPALLRVHPPGTTSAQPVIQDQPRTEHISEMATTRPSLTMLGVSRAFLSTLLPALRGERHFALIESSPSSTQARV